ncbi:hypothetical protein [Rufibacter tibetensis]|uniref:Uncharacterized protein n=1 Tax=Rufibacter tibetensis TaxID=512763 RepID=A0A0N7HX07_9BACT|nr:hypothetical protein [Rufibacter tibetensis]ALJ00721.1 hypothetical protein DC20_19235 [Rufibacter tibetensis]
MKKLDIDSADWIWNGILPRKPENFEEEGVTIGNCVPPIFEAYCKVFHPFEVTADEPDTLENHIEFKEILSEIITFNYKQGTQKSTDPWETNSGRLGRLNQKLWMTDPNLKKWEYVTWQSIAEKYGLKFHNEINPTSFEALFEVIGYPRNLWFPKGGYLPRPVFIKLVSVLRAATDTEQVCVYQIPPNNINEMELVVCSFEEAITYFKEDFIGYLYAMDKSWIVYTDTDLHFTLAAGAVSVISAIMNSELEAIKCESDTRVDYSSDKVNRKKIYT